MDRDGTPRNHDEDPINQTGPLGMEWRDDTDPPGDVLSDDWRDGPEPGHAAVPDELPSTGDHYVLDVAGGHDSLDEDRVAAGAEIEDCTPGSERSVWRYRDGRYQEEKLDSP